jgi:hypothetical protein
MKISVVVIFGLLGLVASSPTSSTPEKRELGYDVGVNKFSSTRHMNHLC